MTASKSQIRREAEQALQEAKAVAASDTVNPENAAPAEEEVLPEGVERFAPEVPPDASTNIVTVVPTSTAQVTVPSGASFSLQPGVAVRMQKRDADYLNESGLAG